MSLTQEELAQRLRTARLNAGLTQEQVGDEIGVSRSAVAAIETGRRSVNSLELSRLATLYGRGVEELLAEEALEPDPVEALCRVSAGFADSPIVHRELGRCANLCREAKRLESLLELDAAGALPITYQFPSLSSRWDAVSQGKSMAVDERSRLQLGSSPVWEVAEIIRRLGVRVTELEMADDISGLFFHGRDVGLVIVVNRLHARTRRMFSYSHEYCHVLADRDRPATISRHANRGELAEIRANSFAAHFLMPEAGVREFVQSLGKGDPSRQLQEIFDGNSDVTAQRRNPPGSQDLQEHDVGAVAHHFGVSYLAALYHLQNLRLVSSDRFDFLKERQEIADRISRVLRTATWDDQVHWSLTEQVLSLALEAYRRDHISRKKLLELAEQTGIDRKQIERAFGADDLEDERDEVLVPD